MMFLRRLSRRHGGHGGHGKFKFLIPPWAPCSPCLRVRSSFFIFHFSFFFFLLSSCPSEAAGPGAVADPAALNYFKDNKLAAGWNLGNSLDSHSNGVGGETGWGNPAVNQAIMNGVKKAGFNLIRIPVTWMGHIGAAPDYTIAPARLARVAEAVDMAHNAGLVVIINLHHDGASESAEKEAGWLSVKKSSASAADRAAITAQFARVWAQIADHFKNYDEWLMFESMNEIHDGGWAWSGAFRSNPQAQFAILNEWNQIFSDTVRAAGGKNDKRFLVIPSYCTVPEATYPGGKLNGQSITIGDLFELPDDSVPGRQVVTFHYYRPDNVGLGSTTSARFDWGNASDKNAVDSAFKPFKAAYIDRNIPVIIGECGATRQVYTDTAKLAQARASRLAYLSHVFGTAKKYGLVPVYWDNGSFGNRTSETFGLFDRATGQPYNFPATTEFKECIEAMINAVR